MTRDDDTVTIDVRSTLDDSAALLLFVSRSPRRLLLQAGLFTALGLWIILMMAFVGMLTAAFDRTRTIGDAIRFYLTHAIAADIGPAVPWIALFCFAVFLANLVVFLPRQCRALVRRILSGYPEIRADDATMAMRTRFRLDPRGVTATTRDERVFVAWRGIKRFVETRRHLYLMTSPSTGFVLPIAELNGRAAEIRDIVTRAIR